MSRFLLMLVFVAWMSFSARAPAVDRAAMTGSVEFLAGYAVLVVLTAAWSRWLARRVDNENLTAHLKRFNRFIGLARLAVVGWFFVGVYFLRWGSLVNGELMAWRLQPDRLD